jgi:ParB family chromosome partitioning protein
MALSLDDLDLLPPGGLPEGGAPLRLPLSAIDEDPEQPRQEFDAQALAELAETIRQRGVRQPVSVRSHPTDAGRWMLNFGARRLRASHLAGLADIPAFVDQGAQSIDQFIENEQRQGLTPLEVALFVQRSLNQGQTQAEIARAIGKSRQYVMIATALIDPPEWLMDAYRQGRCRGLNELHELRKLHAAYPERTQAWAAGTPRFTREQVAAFKAKLAQAANETPAPEQAPPETGPETPAVSKPPRADQGLPAQGQAKASNNTQPLPSLLARLDETVVRVVTTAIPEADGCVYVQATASGARQTVQASRLTLLGFGLG